MKLYHVARGITGGDPYADGNGVDRWSFSTACIVANYLNMLADDVLYHPKEVADPHVRWVRNG